MLDFEFKIDQTLQIALVKKQIEIIIVIADREAKLSAQIRKTFADFEDEFFEIFDKRFFQTVFGMLFGQIEKLENIFVLENRFRQSGEFLSTVLKLRR